ncbi:hypothetical protein CH63R_08884 [Colletotrichum higginsianum IMI 349063]|uniref:Uncharacterized protein n=1 Tax=Colletotrichum higginsianum (strain IMI 349063) TaxID=759273 RepID=A0A1B7Y5T8_COLHI|nr:hypothetical protein CH63R_08884 [Colletotrichum higginsianum IMI 349063]OBR07363.1 hypothetical protein CH63R_08884 [Colletotrichum higginsianum IMI 349063]
MGIRTGDDVWPDLTPSLMLGTGAQPRSSWDLPNPIHPIKKGNDLKKALTYHQYFGERAGESKYMEFKHYRLGSGTIE